MIQRLFFMFYVYILYSASGKKTYTGYTNDVQRRLTEHNITESSGFTLRYRPWALLKVEPFTSKSDAMQREKFLKTGKGREEVRKYTLAFLNNNDDAVSAAAEMD